MATLSYRNCVLALRELELNQESDVIAHVSLAAWGDVGGGVEKVIVALLATCGTVVMPAFTHQTMFGPESGPPENGCTYGDHAEENARAVTFSPQLAVN